MTGLRFFLKKHAPPFLWRLLRISLVNTLASVTYFSCPKVSNAPISKHSYTYSHCCHHHLDDCTGLLHAPLLLPLPLWQPKRASTSAPQSRHSPAWLPTTLRIKSKLPPAFRALWHLDLGSLCLLPGFRSHNSPMRRGHVTVPILQMMKPRFREADRQILKVTQPQREQGFESRSDMPCCVTTLSACCGDTFVTYKPGCKTSRQGSWMSFDFCLQPKGDREA